MRALQLQFREEEMKEITLHKQRLWQKEKEAFDNLWQIRQKEIEKGDIVLKHDP
jgi:hypothetical protein